MPSDGEQVNTYLSSDSKANRLPGAVVGKYPPSHPLVGLDAF